MAVLGKVSSLIKSPSDTKKPDVSLGNQNYSVREYAGEDAWVAAATYIPFVSAAVLLLRKENSEFVLTHAKQALVLTILILLCIMLLSPLPKFVLLIVLTGALIFGSYKAFSGKKFYIPGITELARWTEI